MRVPWNKGRTLKDNPKYRNMGFQVGHTHHEHENCVRSRFQTGGVGHSTPHTEATRRKISASRRGKCQGENNPSYKDGMTPLLLKIKRLPEYMQWRRAVLQRDNFTCRKCFKRGGKLESHHITSFSHLVAQLGVLVVNDAVEKTELWKLDNGVTLCVPCHKQTPNYGYRATMTPFDDTIYQLTLKS